MAGCAGSVFNGRCEVKTENQRKRIKWIDAAKAIGIIAIFLGHIPDESGTTCSSFVWNFHVPLFFFLSGCTEALGKEKRIAENLLKKAKEILVPWLLFCFMCLLTAVLERKAFLGDVKHFIAVIMRGTIRNQYFAGALWFLTGLFVVQFVFSILRKIKKPLLILMISCTIHYFTRSALSKPIGVFNYDSALVYLIYYVAGFVLFPYIQKIMDGKTQVVRFILVFSGIIAILYFCFSYYSKDVLHRFTSLVYVGCYITVLRTLLLIFAVCVIARFFENAELLQKVGTNTLFLCGSEYLATSLIIGIMNMLGAEIVVKNQFMGLIYVAVKIGVAFVLLIPVEKYILNRLYELPGYLFARHSKNEN